MKGLKLEPGWRRAWVARLNFWPAKLKPPTSARSAPVSCSFIAGPDDEVVSDDDLPGRRFWRWSDDALVDLFTGAGFDDVHLNADALIPGIKSFRNVSEVLYSTRIGVAWSALGHATAVFESALAYSTQRQQFGKYLAEHQMVQERLTRMLSDLVSMQLYMVRIAELEAAGTLKPTQAALAKYNNTRVARRIAADARDMLGGNGILLENGVIQHMADIEGIHTYEGTESVQALLVGRDITGHGAFA